MIVDRLSNSDIYASLGERFAAAFAFLRSVGPSDFEEKTVEIDGRHVFAMFQPYETAGDAGSEYEAHVAYADLQYVLEGEETIRVTDVEPLTPTTEYHAENDYTLFRLGPGTDVRLVSGDFVLLFPQDAHVPKLATSSPGSVKKIVVKIRV